MKLHLLSLFVLSTVAASLSVGCSAETSSSSGEDGDGDGDDVSVDEANAARVTPGSFKLYTDPNAAPNPNCDVHTKLDLAAAPHSTAKLEEAVEGSCEIAVIPNPRTYRLRLANTSCGSLY